MRVDRILARHRVETPPPLEGAAEALAGEPSSGILHITDATYLAGSGIMAHPDDPAARLHAIRLACDAAVTGVPLEKHARDRAALAAATT